MNAIEVLIPMGSIVAKLCNQDLEAVSHPNSVFKVSKKAVLIETTIIMIL